MLPGCNRASVSYFLRLVLCFLVILSCMISKISFCCNRTISVACLAFLKFKPPSSHLLTFYSFHINPNHPNFCCSRCRVNFWKIKWNILHLSQCSIFYYLTWLLFVEIIEKGKLVCKQKDIFIQS